MRADRAALADLVAPHHDPVVALLDQVKVNIRFILLRGPLPAIALGVGDGAGDGQVLRLGHLEPVVEALVVLRAQGLVHFPCRRSQGVEGIAADAAVVAGAHGLAGQKGHLLAHVQIVDIAGHVEIAVDGLTGQVGFGHHDSLVLGLLRQIVDRRIGHDHGLCDRIV